MQGHSHQDLRPAPSVELHDATQRSCPFSGVGKDLSIAKFPQISRLFDVHSPKSGLFLGMFLSPTISLDRANAKFQPMRIHSFPMKLGLLAATFLVASLQPVRAQTPSPLQEWQYSGGIILARLFEPDLPRFRTILGLAAEVQPVYDGSRAYRLEGGPVINIHYRDIAFISTGEGLGYNLLRGDHYQLGIGVTYDLGRKEKDDLTNLHGMGNIGAAPVGKLFGTWVLSR